MGTGLIVGNALPAASGAPTVPQPRFAAAALMVTTSTQQMVALFARLDALIVPLPVAQTAPMGTI